MTLPGAGAGAGAGDRSIQIGGDQSGGLNVTGDNNQITVSFGVISEKVTTPTTVEGARRLLYGNPRPPAPMGRSVVGWLGAGASVVEVQSRRDVEELAGWATSPGVPVMRLVTGAGGQGKTVLGRLVCDEVAEQGWLTGFVRLPPPGWRSLAADASAAHTVGWVRRWAEIIAAVTALPNLPAETPAAGGGLGVDPVGGGLPGVLLVVDYAENQAEALSDLLAQVVAPTTGEVLTERVRVLLLARHDRDWWQDLSREHPEHAWVDPTPLRLGSLSGELAPGADVEVWSGAVAAFAARAGAAGLLHDTAVAAASEAVLAESPVPPAVSTTLDLYATALLAVLDHATTGPAGDGGKPLRDAGDPLRGVLDHEERFVAAALAGAGLVLEPAQRSVAITAAFLVPAGNLSTGTAALGRAPSLAGLDPGQLGRLAAQLGLIYPDPAGSLWRPPVPDRLPDTHLLLTLEQAATDDDATGLVLAITEELGSEQATTVLTVLTRAASTPGADLRLPAGLRRLTRATEHLITTRPDAFLTPAITLAPGTHQAAILAVIPTLSRPETQALDKVLSQLGFATTRTHIAVAVSEQLLRFWEATPPADDPARKHYADDLAIQAIRLSEVGRREEAPAPAEEAVTIYRGLAEADPAAYLPDLAMSLANFGKFLSEVGRSEEALAPAEEAVTTRRGLAEADPAGHMPDLATALDGLGTHLWLVGRREEALAPAVEAVAIGRGLAEANPAVYLPDLAMSLNNLGIRLSGVGRFEQALAPTQEAVTTYRGLASTNPAAYLPNLAMSLNNLGIRLSGVGRGEEALVPAEEAVAIRRGLAEANPAAYLPALAVALNNFGIRLSEVGRRKDALVPAEEAVRLYRELAEANPAAYLPDLAMSLTNFGTHLWKVGRSEEALVPAEEAVRLSRGLAEANPAAYLPDLAMSLANFGKFLSEVGRREEALDWAEEAVTVYRGLTEVSPAAYLPDLAGSLTNLGSSLSQVGRNKEALTMAVEGMTIYRGLAEANPAAYLPDLAASWNNLGIRLSGVGRREEALAPAEEAVTIYRGLAEANPAAYLPDLAAALSNFGIRLSEVGRGEEALAPGEEAATVYRGLAEANPAAYRPDLAQSLWAVGWICATRDTQSVTGLAAVEEAVGIYAELARRTPSVFEPNWRAAQSTRAELLDGLGRAEDAAKVRQLIEAPNS